jgi:hypothetical protein
MQPTLANRPKTIKPVVQGAPFENIYDLLEAGSKALNVHDINPDEFYNAVINCKTLKQAVTTSKLYLTHA